MPNLTTDIVVVGSGAIGTSAARQRGAMVREHYLHPVLVRMAMESRTIFENFA